MQYAQDINLLLTNILLSLFAMLALSLMSIINRLEIPGTIHNPGLRIDNKIPLKLFAIPIYFFYFPYIVGVWVYMFFLEADRFSIFALAMILIGVVTGIINVIYQTQAPRVDVPGEDVLSKMLKWHYGINKPRTALPSLHVSQSLAVSIILTVFYPSFIFLWLSIGISISISTLLAKEHYVLDVIAGTALGLSASFLVVNFL